LRRREPSDSCLVFSLDPAQEGNHDIRCCPYSGDRGADCRDPHFDYSPAAQHHRRDLFDRHRPHRARACALSCARTCATSPSGRKDGGATQSRRMTKSSRSRPKARSRSKPVRSAGTGSVARSRKVTRGPKPVARGRKAAWVYTFGDGKAEGRAGMRGLLGGKGAGLAEMANLGLPVPPGFTITTEVCSYFYAHDKSYPQELRALVGAGLAHVSRITGKKFGDPSVPLLVSVRSGARASMPGMMDTVLNLGLNDATVGALAKKSGDRRFAYDSFRRFITMYSDVVLGLEHHHFEQIL